MAKKSLRRLVLAALLAVLWVASAWAQDAKTLVSTKTATAPAIDGKVDAAWSSAKPLKIALTKTPYEPKDFKGEKHTTVTIRSLYDSEYAYFLVEWDDPTLSVERTPWVKQANGSWKMMAAPDETGHENTYADDKLAMFWDINAGGFQFRGCASACHKERDGQIDGKDAHSPARKFTNKAGETIDMWQWKAARTNPVGQMDDGYVDDTKDPAKNADWGRKNDDQNGGGYAENISADKKGPAFMNKAPSAANKYWVLDSEKVAFTDTFKPGDVVGSTVVAPLTGSRGNITAVGAWANGKWTLEIKRKLVTTGANVAKEDVQFNDLKKTYYFGVAAFDNTQINHMYHEGSYKLMFK